MRSIIVLSRNLQKEHSGEVSIRCYYLPIQCCEHINKCDASVGLFSKYC